MFKNETLVKWVVCSLMALPAYADTPNTSSSDPRITGLLSAFGGGAAQCAEEMKAWKDAETEYAKAAAAANPKSEAVYKKLAEKMEKNYDKCSKRSPTNLGCGNAPSNFTNAMNLFASACRGLNSGASVAGNIACGHMVARCDCPSVPAGSAAATKLNCAADSASTLPMIDSSGRLNVTAAEEKFRMCPLAAATDQEKLEKELREAQKEVRELEKKAPELKQAMGDALSAKDEKIQQADQQLADAKKQQAQQKAEILKRQREASRAAVEKAATLADQISTLEGELKERESAREDSLNALNEQKLKAEEQCYAEAIARVNAEQNERMILRKARLDNGGGFNQMLRKIGLSDKAAWQKMAKGFFNDCKRAGPFREKTQAANERYYTEIKRSRDKDSTIREKIGQLRQQIIRAKDPNACSLAGVGVGANGQVTDSEACQAFRTALEDQQRADDDFEAQRLLNAKAVANAKKEARRKVDSKGAELARAEQDAENERTRLANLRKLLDLKRQYAPGGNIDGKDASDVYMKHGAMVGFAAELVRCSSPAECGEDALCNKAAQYLVSIGRDPIYGRSTEPSRTTGTGGTDDGKLSTQLGTTPGNGSK